MAADVDAVAFVVDGARKAAHLARRLEDRDIRVARAGELVGGSEARGAGADDDDLQEYLVKSASLRQAKLKQKTMPADTSFAAS